MWAPTEDFLLNGPGVDSDTEALQTDIQRFIAIVAFCLLGIFSLVQSLPQTPPINPAVIENLGRKLALQKAALEKFLVENRELKKQVDDFRARKAGDAKRQNATAALEEKIRAQAEKIARLLSEKRADSRDLAAATRDLDVREKEITRIRREKERIEAALAAAIAKAMKAEASQREKDRLGSVAKKLTAKAADPVDAEAENRKSATGVRVAFASDRALISLIAEEKVQLFILIEHLDAPFQTRIQGGVIDFPNHAPDQDLDLWRIHEAQVPEEILARFRRWTTLASREKDFVIGLDGDISRAIRRSTVKNGRFRINADGTVTVNPD